MKRRAWLLPLLCLGLAAGGALAAEERGTRTCRKWTEERRLAEGTKDMNRVPVLISKAWFLGFLAGRAAGGKGDLLGNIDNESIFLWLDNHCRDHAQDNLAAAAAALERELLQGQGRAR